MIKREHCLWILSGCSLLIGAVGAVTGINANTKADKANNEPTSNAWKWLSSNRDDITWVKTIFERSSNATDSENKTYLLEEANYVITENVSYGYLPKDAVQKLKTIYIKGVKYSGQTTKWEAISYGN